MNLLTHVLFQLEKVALTFGDIKGKLDVLYDDITKQIERDKTRAPPSTVSIVEHGVTVISSWPSLVMEKEIDKVANLQALFPPEVTQNSYDSGVRPQGAKGVCGDWQGTLTHAGDLTGPHNDEPLLMNHHLQLSSMKLWFTWLPTLYNLKKLVSHTQSASCDISWGMENLDQKTMSIHLM